MRSSGAKAITGQPRYKGLSAQFETIDSDQAKEYLKQNKSNRPLRERTVSRYAKDMKAGRWRLTCQGIGFDRHGALMDGQHRLHAVILSGATIVCLVVRGLEPEANDGLDLGFNRGVDDVLHYRGIQADKIMIGVMRWVSFDISRGVSGIKELTRQERVDLFLQHQDVIALIVSMFRNHKPSARMRLAPVMAVFVRAYQFPKYRSRLSHAAEVLVSGVGGEDDRWLIMARNFFQSLKTVQSEVIRREIYLKTERALHAWLNGEEVVGNLRPTKDELFPFPWERKGAKAKTDQAAE